MAARTRTLRLLAPGVPEPPRGPISIDLSTHQTVPTMENGAQKTENPDGSVTIDLSPQTSAPDQQSGFYENLANKIDEAELGRIASELLDNIERDDQSRREWLDTRARGIKLLGLKLDEPRADFGTSSAPLEGMSTIRHPLLLDSVLRFHANARGELLPSAGPVKVRNDAPVQPMPPGAPLGGVPPPPPPTPPPGAAPPGGGPPGMPPGMPPPPMAAPPAPPPPMPHRQMGGPAPPPPMTPPGMPPPMNGAMPPMGMPPMMGHNGGPPLDVGMSWPNEELANALETDMNHYLTATATEYYPDTDRMLFWVGAGGQGIKKVFNCPLKRRPVSESVDAEDIIVSNATTNLENSGRITHRIKMRPSTLKRMQIIGAYRDVELSAPVMTTPTNPVDKAKMEIQGVKLAPQKPEETDHEIYESYCELNIAGFEHKIRGKVTGLQLPYKVVIHKESRKILEVRRNWEQGDKLCIAKEYFVDFPFVRAMGFYAIGLIHIAGNTTNALTASWREMLDAGMFASFPGFLYAKNAGRQLTNQFRCPPGGGIPLEVGTGRLQDSVMALPYKEPGPAFTAFIQHVEEVGQRVAGSAEIEIGEGNQEVPVGTTMAIIEQATKVMDAVHKRLHAAQAKEFQLLKKRFKEDPEAFWRHNKRPTIQWRKDQFISALENCDLVPVADPNNPTALHRIMKATVVKTMAMQSPQNYDMMAVDKRVFRIAGIDYEGLFNQNPTPPPPDPKMMAVQQKAQASQQQAQLQHADITIKAATAQQNAQFKAAELASRERVEQIKLQQADKEIERETIIHAHDAAMGQAERQHQMAADHAANMTGLVAKQAQAKTEMAANQAKAHQEMMTNAVRHAQSIRQADEMHQQKLESARQLGEEKVQIAKKLAKARPKPKKPGA